MNKIYCDKKVINIIDEASNLTFSLKNSQMLVINCYFKKSSDLQINVCQENDSYLVINYAGYIQSDVNIDINVEVSGNNNKTVIKTRTIAEKNHANFNVSVKVKEKTKNNEITEDLKAISEKGTISFMPILKIDTNEVNAEHFATIGGFDEKELFYLESKGLSTNMAKEILKISFINNLFSDAFLSMLDNGKELHE